MGAQVFLLKKLRIFLLVTLFSTSTSAFSAGELNIINWSDYIAPDTIKNFEEKYDIKVNYSLMDSNEILEAKLLAGNSGFDIIVPSLHVLKRLSQAGLILELDKSKLKNSANLDPKKMAKIATVDEQNRFGIPYLELSTGIGLNPQAVKKALGVENIPESFDLLFKKEYLEKITQCGISVLDSPSDVICSSLMYLGLDPETSKKEDYAKASALLSSIMPYITYIHSSQYANDLASGDLCLALAWSGDVQLASQRRVEAGLEPLVYIIPKEGALMGYDMLAIPKDSPHVENAYLFLDYILQEKVSADISNYVRYANANQASYKLIDPEILNNKGIFYDEKTLERMQIVVPSSKLERLMTRTWNKVRANAGD